MIILGWNRDHEDTSWPDYDDVYDFIEVELSGTVSESWSVGNHVNIEEGESCFLLVQGQKHPRGVVAWGRVESGPERRPHWIESEARAGKSTNYIRWEILEMLPKGSPIPIEVLEQRVPGVPWRHIYSSGFYVPGESEEPLLDLWQEHHPLQDDES